MLKVGQSCNLIFELVQLTYTKKKKKKKKSILEPIQPIRIFLFLKN